ncbi:MAG: hypothetical protein KKF50_05305 [Nanoarchaeota archaeon]|nr:hypothetical protein [Nanoarchaeota archaeon]
MAKRIIADKNNHVCVTEKAILAQLRKPTTKGRQKMQEARRTCTKYAALMKMLQVNY